ncbi:PRC-barrel domain-containing protein [soil metagenome]
MTPTVLSSATLTGDTIVNGEGTDLGTLKDLMIDLGTGEVAYAVLARGGFAGVGEKLFAVPWQLLVVDGDNKRLILDLDEEILEDSPGFDPDNWPSFSDQEWRRGVHEYFGLEPVGENTPPI